MSNAEENKAGDAIMTQMDAKEIMLRSEGDEYFKRNRGKKTKDIYAPFDPIFRMVGDREKVRGGDCWK
jgi:hypothetical protein